MREIEWKIISELMKNSRLSDRELAKKIGSSQPTVTRARNRLEKEGYIKEYTMIPDFRKLGFEILAVSFVKFKNLTPERIEEVRRAGRELEKETPTPTVAIMHGMGLGQNRIFISLHKNYASFVEITEMAQRLPFVDISRVESFIVSLDEEQYRPLSLNNLAQYLVKSREKKE